MNFNFSDSFGFGGRRAAAGGGFPVPGTLTQWIAGETWTEADTDTGLDGGLMDTGGLVDDLSREYVFFANVEYHSTSVGGLPGIRTSVDRNGGQLQTNPTAEELAGSGTQAYTFMHVFEKFGTDTGLIENFKVFNNSDTMRTSDGAYAVSMFGEHSGFTFDSGILTGPHILMGRATKDTSGDIQLDGVTVDTLTTVSTAIASGIFNVINNNQVAMGAFVWWNRYLDDTEVAAATDYFKTRYGIA